MTEMYKLVNPYIDGSMNISFEGENGIDAANKAWDTISENLTNNVPKFAFSLEKVNDGTLQHFVVSEMLSGNKDVSFSIDELSLGMTPIQEQVFKKLITESAEKRNSIQKQNGGYRRRYEDDDSSVSSSSSSTSSEEKELYNKLRYMKIEADSHKPVKKITYWWYNPTVYKLNNLYIPTFKVPLSPYVQLNTNSSYWGL